MSFYDRIAKSFDNACRLPLSEKSRYVVFSDCHRGTGKANDNFLKNENEKRLKYNPDDIFKDRLKNNIEPKENVLMPIKKEKNNFFINLIRKLKAIIKKKDVNK